MSLMVPRYDAGKFLVVGDVMLDRYWSGPVQRISPEAPVPVVKVTMSEDRVGGAANVAMNLSALGAAVTIMGITGRDEASDSLSEHLSAAGVSCDFVVDSASPTITKLRVLGRNQQLIRLDFEEAFSASSVADLAKQVVDIVSDYQAVILSDYAKGAVEDPQTIIQAAKKARVPVLVDPKACDFEKYAGATLLTPNMHEFEEVVGVCQHEDELVERGLALIEKLDLTALLVTRGEQGMTLLRQNAPAFHLPARAKEVYDVTGAGDTVISVLAASLAITENFESSVELANLAASIVVGKVGTAAISAPELRRAVQMEQGSARGKTSPEQLQLVIDDARAHKEKIVFTNGCFDILHAGHVSYLEEAKALGDRLVVAINSDASVKRLKGDGRPINSVERRMAVLSALESVDWVTWFDGDTPELLLEQVKPDVLVKGGDYQIDEVVGAPIVEAYGGEVKVLSLVDSCSTTAIVEKIRDK